MDASTKDKDDDEADGTSVGENGDDSNANDDSPTIGDEKASGATDKDDNNDGSVNDKDDEADGTSVRENSNDSNDNDNSPSGGDEEASRTTDNDGDNDGNNKNTGASNAMDASAKD
jgi:hypothetical protein